MPGWLVAWFQDGTVIAIAVTILAAEIAVLARRGPRGAILNALSGIALLLALGAALAEPRSYALVALCLTAGFAAHVADLAIRLRR